MIAGIDTDTKAIHLVTLDPDTDDADYHRYRLDVGPPGYHEKARRLPLLLPVRGAWRDAGVSLIAIEEPFGDVFRGVVPLAVIRGALLASLPRDEQCRVVMIPPHEWKKWSLGGGFPGKGNARKDEVAEWVKATWTNRPAEGLDHNACDAYAVAYAARALDDRRRELAA